MQEKEIKAIKNVAQEYIKNTGRKFATEMLDFDSAAVLDLLLSKKKGKNIKYFLENNSTREEQFEKIKQYISSLIEREHSWKYMSNTFYKRMEEWIEKLFIQNKGVKFYKPKIVKLMKEQGFYKDYLKMFPDLDLRFSTEFSKDILEGDRRISDAITHIKKKIRDDAFEDKDSYNGCYIVGAQEAKALEKQAGWEFTDDKMKIKNETYSSSKAGTLRAITNLRYAMKMGLIDELNINMDVLDSLQEIEEKLSNSLKKDKNK